MEKEGLGNFLNSLKTMSLTTDNIGIQQTQFEIRQNNKDLYDSDGKLKTRPAFEKQLKQA